MRLLDMVLLGLVAVIILVSFVNPGGALFAAGIAAVIIGVRLLAPWLGDYIVSSHSGKKARMKAQQARDGHDNGGNN